MFVTQRLAASATGVCWAGAWLLTSIDRDSFPHGTRPARRASTRTRSARDSAHADGHPARRVIGLVRHDGHPARRAIGLVQHDGHPARRAIGLVRPVSGMGVMDRQFSRASIPMSGDRCALVRVRQRGTSVYDRPASVFRDEGGPTPRLSRAAERAFRKRHGVQAKICSQHSGWRRRLQAYVGPGHGR